MCGLAGAIGLLDAEIDGAVRSMSVSMRHRGPDGEGYWRSDDVRQTNARRDGVVFAHRRLAVIDLREIANQPMHDPVSGNVIIFNGEIYNYKELRNDLRSRGHAFETEGDTEVLLKAYAQWGAACLEYLRGMFAFALWDPVRKSVLLARDRLGIKPLYYTSIRQEGGHLILFASEVRSLLASGRVARQLDDLSVHAYLWHGFVPGPRTIVSGVSCIEPGCYIEVERSGKIGSVKRYWSAPLSGHDGIDDTDRAREVLNEAVGIRLRSDVPVGVFLSGGVDSSVVANAVKSSVTQSVATFSIGFKESGFDETTDAATFADSIGVANTTHTVDRDDFLKLLPEALGAMDQPTFDGINSYLVSKTVRDHGIKVALSGTGGDELFGGYSSFKRLYKAHQNAFLAKLLPPAWLRAGGRSLQWLSKPKQRQIRSFIDQNKSVEMLVNGDDAVAGYQSLYSVFNDALISRLHNYDAGEAMRYGLEVARLERLQKEISGYPVESAVGYLEIQSFLSERVLRDADAASMAVSLELRLPLIDHRFVEILSQYPSRLRYRPFGKKVLLKTIGLSEQQRLAFDRPKSGFNIPISEWISDTLAREINAMVSDAKIAHRIQLSPAMLNELLAFNTRGNRAIAWPRIWSTYVLMRWCNLNGVFSR